jgi:hypothetical protein
VTGFLAALLATGVLAGYGWRLPVLAPVPVAVLALLLAVRYRDTPTDGQRQSLDVWGCYSARGCHDCISLGDFRGSTERMDLSLRPWGHSARLPHCSQYSW